MDFKQIIDEKSLIKKYQNEIRLLKEELEQLKKGILNVPELKESGGQEIVLLKQKVCWSLWKYSLMIHWIFGFSL